MASKKKIKISIEDNGIGIAKQDLRKLFKLKSNIKRKGTNNEKGSGLGLIICNEFVNYHQGKIVIKSDENTGSIFTIELPRQQNL